MRLLPWSASPSRRCPQAYEWSGTALQEKEAAGQTGIILALATTQFRQRCIPRHRETSGRLAGLFLYQATGVTLIAAQTSSVG
jgi:hypothetical protein